MMSQRAVGGRDAGRLLDAREVAEILGISRATLLTWRSRRPGFGPRACVLSSTMVRWRASDVWQWVDQHMEDGREEWPDE